MPDERGDRKKKIQAHHHTRKKAGAECAEMMTLQTLPHDPMYQCVNKPESYYFHLGGIK